MAGARLIAVGQKMPDWVQTACTEYLSRFRHHFKLILEELPASKKAGAAAKEEHRRRLLDRLKPSDLLVLLDERGQSYSTVELAEQLTRWELTSRSLVFALGGADGWCEGMWERADSQWSLSRLVFPHSLARIIVVEQLYRADSVRRGHPYHRS
ncbi:MAG: 23S rRNA (pseudouridine(1915)-N(3))-methyltransferase RlmH [Gammaproteobacteria bacterium]|nr:23S rRNA (pseudouridine(1915)-N(3))-methyltransferase RlmH [Gammaproteobacteria bacterium]|tara:strand:- start:1258 stop:1719 length:462 start_codon:yes stop_codon:yes gene_type:complete